MSNRKDKNIDSFVDENILANDDFDEMLRSFNVILLQENVDPYMDNINADVYREKEDFEEFSSMLEELEKDGENLNPIILGSNLDELCQPMMAAPFHIPPIAQQNPMHPDCQATYDYDKSEDFEVQENKTLSTSVGNGTTTNENNDDFDNAQSTSPLETDKGSSRTCM